MSLESLIKALTTTPQKGLTKLIAIDGRGGSGKSSLAKKLSALHPEIKILSVDSFPCSSTEYPFHSSGTQTRVDLKRLREEVLLPLFKGITAHYTETPWWSGQSPGPKRAVKSGGLVIVEGCYSLHRELRDLYDLKIWIDCPADQALRNAIKRDAEEMREVWEQVYSPNETAYILSHAPSHVADFVVVKGGEGEFQLQG